MKEVQVPVGHKHKRKLFVSNRSNQEEQLVSMRKAVAPGKWTAGPDAAHSRFITSTSLPDSQSQCGRKPYKNTL